MVFAAIFHSFTFFIADLYQNKSNFSLIGRIEIPFHKMMAKLNLYKRMANLSLDKMMANLIL